MTDSPDDMLSAAAAAARAVADAGVDDGAATRLRLRTSLGEARPRAGSRRKLTVIAAIFGTFIGSTAFAYAVAVHEGWQPPWRSSGEAVIETPPSPSPPVAVSAIAPVRGRVVREEVPAPSPSPAAADDVEVAPAPPPIAAAPRPIAPASRVATAPPPIAAVSPPAESPTPTPTPTPTQTPAVAVSPAPASDIDNGKSAFAAELAEYRVAYEAHFRGNDPVVALEKWDRYLRAYPDGRLAPEARYDRALVLVKLQRWAEARDALRPFAATAGGYHQREAAELLAAIAKR